MILFTLSKPILEYTTQRERWIETWRRGISCIRLSPQWNRKRRRLYENKSSCGGGTPLPLSDRSADHFTGDKRDRERLSQRQGLKDRGEYERMVATTIKKWYRQGRPESGSWSKERRTEAGRGGDRRRGRHRAGVLEYLEGRRTPKPRPLPGPTQPRSPAATKPQWRCPGFRREARGVTCRSQP